MAEVLRTREKERLNQEHLFSEALPIDEAAFTLTLPGHAGGGSHFGLMSLSIDPNDLASSKYPAATRKNVSLSFLLFLNVCFVAYQLILFADM